MKNAWLCCGMPQGTSRAEVTSNSKKIKPVASTVIDLCLSEGISLLQSVSRKFCSNLLGGTKRLGLHKGAFHKNTLIKQSVIIIIFLYPFTS